MTKQDIVRLGDTPGISHPVRGNNIDCAKTAEDMFMDSEELHWNYILYRPPRNSSSSRFTNHDLTKANTSLNQA